MASPTRREDRRRGAAALALALVAAAPVLSGVERLSAQAPDALPGGVAGAVTLIDEGRAERPPRYYRGPFRAAHGDDPAPPPVLSVVVYVEAVPAPPGGWPIPSQPASMRQHHDRFIPHVLPLLAGTPVTFPNDDNYYHNVFSVVAGDRFDLGRFGQGDSRSQTFAEPALVVVRCEIHPGMKAYILVRDNPHFAVPDGDGRYRLDRVPAGTFTVTAWHPTRGQESRAVVVTPGSVTAADFAF